MTDVPAHVSAFLRASPAISYPLLAPLRTPYACLGVRGCWARLDFFSRKPLQKLAVSKALHAGGSPAWRLTSALTGVKQRRQDVRVNLPHAALKNSTIFSQVCGKRTPAGPSILGRQGGHRESAAEPAGDKRWRGWPGEMQRHARERRIGTIR